MPMEFVDTHAHLASADFREDLATVLGQAREAGVGAVIAVTEDLTEAERALELATQHPGLRPAAGIHPDRVVGLSSPAPLLAEFAALAELARLRRGELVALGEVGLDFWKAAGHEERLLQETLLTSFVALARELDLPLSVHSRAAGRATIELLRRSGAERVVLHAFDGKRSTADPGLEAGYFFSVPPSLVRSPQKQKLFKRFPLERLLLETDSPVLGATPGARNEPACVVRAAEELARLQGVSLAEVAEVTTRNARTLFRLPGGLSGSDPGGLSGSDAGGLSGSNPGSPTATPADRDRDRGPGSLPHPAATGPRPRT